MTDLVMAYLTLGNLEPSALVKAAAQGGFAATALRLTGHAPGDPWAFDPASKADRKALRAVADEAGIALQNASTYRFGPQASHADYLPVLESCAELGIGTVTANSFDGDRAQTTDLLSAVAETAGSLGIRIAIEFIPVSAIRTAEDAQAIAQATGQANVGIVVDALHLWRSGGTPASVVALDRARLFAVQLCDAPLAGPAPEGLAQEMRAGRLLPGEGEFDLRGLMRALPASVEIEIEAPSARFEGLPPAERARIAHKAGTEFLNRLARDGAAHHAPASNG